MEMEELVQELKETEKHISEWQKKADEIRKLISKKQREDFIADLEKGSFDFDPEMTFQEIETKSKDLTWEQLRYLVYKIHGPDATYPQRSWRQSIYSRVYCTGDISWHEYSDGEYKRLLLVYLREASCKYCKKISHVIVSCPILDKFKCDACGKRGHTVHKCRDVSSLRKFASRHK